MNLSALHVLGALQRKEVEMGLCFKEGSGKGKVFHFGTMFRSVPECQRLRE